MNLNALYKIAQMTTEDPYITNYFHHVGSLITGITTTKDLRERLSLSLFDAFNHSPSTYELFKGIEAIIKHNDLHGAAKHISAGLWINDNTIDLVALESQILKELQQC